MKALYIVVSGKMIYFMFHILMKAYVKHCHIRHSLITHLLAQSLDYEMLYLKWSLTGFSGSLMIFKKNLKHCFDS